MPPQVHVRPASLEDAEAIAALAPSEEDVRQAAPQESAPLDPQVIGHWLSQRRSGFVLELDGRLVGYAELNPDEHRNRVYWIGHVMILPGARGAGLGRTLVGSLLRHGLSRLRAKEIRISAFEDNPAALKSYKSCGFTDGGRRMFDGRVLIDLRVKNYWLQRVIPRVPAGFMVLAAAGLTAILLPSEARFWLNDVGGGSAVLPLLGACVIGGSMGWLFQPLLPRRAGKPTERLLLPVVYGAVVGIATSLAVLGVGLVLFQLGVVPSSAAPGSLDHVMAGGQMRNQSELLLHVISQSLALGSGWGLVLSFVVNGLQLLKTR